MKKLRDKSLFVMGGGEWERYWGALGITWYRGNKGG